MHNIQIILTNDSEIKIELLDNPFIAEFIEQILYVRKHYTIASWKQNIPEPHISWDQNKIDFYCSLLIKYINKLNDMGLNFPISPDEVVIKDMSDKSRQLLNDLHRHFTTGENSLNDRRVQEGTWRYNTQYTFNRPDYDRIGELFDCFHGINYAVHDIESYFTNERIKNFRVRSEYQVEFKGLPSPSEYVATTDNLEPDDKIKNLENNMTNIPQNYFKTIKKEHYDFFSDDILKHNVWLPLYQIQGKDYVRAYFDYDDPTEWDISTNIVYSGCFSIGDRSWAKDPSILDYLKSYGITPGPMECGMPLGYVVQGEELVSSLETNNVKKVLINGE